MYIRHRRSAVVRLVTRPFLLPNGFFVADHFYQTALKKGAVRRCSAQTNSTNVYSPSSVCCGAPCTAHFLFAIFWGL